MSASTATADLNRSIKKKLQLRCLLSRQIQSRWRSTSQARERRTWGLGFRAQARGLASPGLDVLFQVRLGLSGLRTRVSRGVLAVSSRTVMNNVGYDLTAEQLKELVKGWVDDRLRELLGDPDLGMPMGEALRERLKQSLVAGERISGDEVADKLGLRW